MSKTMVNVLLLVLSIGLAVAGQISMKTGMQKVVKESGELEFSDFKQPVELVKKVGSSFWAVFGIVLYAVSAVFWIFVLSRIDLSVAYPLVAFGYVVVVFYSWLVFKEEVKWFTWIGLVFIVIGVVIAGQGLSAGKKEEKSEVGTAVVQSQALPGTVTEIITDNDNSIGDSN